MKNVHIMMLILLTFILFLPEERRTEVAKQNGWLSRSMGEEGALYFKILPVDVSEEYILTLFGNSQIKCVNMYT